MKKIIAIITALVLVASISVIFYGCGNDMDMPENSTIKTTINTTIDNITEPSKNDGFVTDESEKGDNGAIGEAVTKTSEKISNAMTKASERMSEVFD